MKPFLHAAVLSLSLVSSCFTSGPGTDPGPDDLETLTGWMSGTFSSEAQAAEDPENYFAIRLVMLPIWTDREDGPWLYVEQAASDQLDRPYRQRVYHLIPGSGGNREGIRSEVYTLPGDPLELAAAWKEPQKLAGIGPENLIPRTGCTIYLTVIHQGEACTGFVGSTRGRGCSSSLAGASFATSEVRITETMLESWDRGFDEEGEQVWGATEGAYRFAKLLDGPPRD